MRCFHSFHGRGTRLSVLSVAAGALATVASLAAPSYAGIVTFGSDGNTFNMEFVTIGNAGNAADTTGSPNPAGAVGYEYAIGKFEVSRDMITKYNATSGTVKVSLYDLSSGFAAGGNGPNRPATGISWNEAARFVNWHNTSTGNQAAYKFTTSGYNDNIALWTSGEAGYDVNNKYRNSLAKYFLPNANEWYKAAYYNPTNNTYYDYTNGSNTIPIAVASGTTAGTAVYGNAYSTGPVDVKHAGGLSPYGVMGLGGNVFELEESSFDLTNGDGSSSRGVRGGDWYSGGGGPITLSSSIRQNIASTNEGLIIGFRVASLSSSAAAVPEPNMMVIGTSFGLSGLMAKRRMKK